MTASESEVQMTNWTGTGHPEWERGQVEPPICSQSVRSLALGLVAEIRVVEDRVVLQN